MHNPGGKQGAHLILGHRLREPGCPSQAQQTMVSSRVWAWEKLGRQRITTGLGSVSVGQGAAVTPWGLFCAGRYI